MKILIIIPAYNEEANIEFVVNNLINNYSQYDYLIINDGSKDNTAQICYKNNYNFIDLPVNLGLAGAFQTGIKYAYRNGYDAVLQFDGDGQHQPQYIETLIEEMKTNNTDIVIGSRFESTGKKPNNLRMLGSNMIQLAIRFTTGARITDPTSGMRLFNKRIMKQFAENMNYGPEPDTIAYSILRGAKIKEVQVEMKERIAGESYLNMTRAMQYMMRMCVSISIFQWFRGRGA